MLHTGGDKGEGAIALLHEQMCRIWVATVILSDTPDEEKPGIA